MNAAQVADALGAGIASRDVDTIRKLYADDIVVWHGATGRGQAKEENIGLLDSVFRVTSSLQYVDIVRHEIEGGIVQQHKLVGTFDDGTPIPDLAACLLMKISDGKLYRIDEYFDFATFEPILKQIESLQAEDELAKPA